MKSTRRLLENLLNDDVRKAKIDLQKANQFVLEQRIYEKKKAYIEQLSEGVACEEEETEAEVEDDENVDELKDKGIMGKSEKEKRKKTGVVKQKNEKATEGCSTDYKKAYGNK